MTIFNVLSLIGGLALFLYGMEIMGNGLEKLGGGKLERILERLTSSPIKGVLLGFVVTGIIQSSSATTVMVVGFVNSGIMKLSQAIGITMGANIGTTVTAWILSLSGIQGESFWINMCKPENFTPILAIIGVFVIMMSKSNKKKNTANIILGFTVLMFGMSTMSSAVEPLKDVPEFTNILVMFENPILGVLAGMVLTAIIQSSSASVGILQALSATGAITFGSAIPIILGQNIGTCITVVLSAIGTSKNAKRAAAVHLYFNVIGTILFLSLFYIVNAFVHFSFLNDAVTPVNIAIVHTLFNLMTTAVFLPFTNLLEKLAKWTIKDGDATDKFSVLDEKYFQNPQFALDQSMSMTGDMAKIARETLELSITSMTALTEKLDAQIIENETQLDEYEDVLSKYLVRLSARTQGVHQSRKVTMLLHAVSEFEQMTDYETNILHASRAKSDKGYTFSEQANAEMEVLVSAVRDIMDRAITAFTDNDLKTGFTVEPLADVVDTLCDELKKRHIDRMQQGVCTVETGILFTDYVAALEKISSHCKNTAAFVIQMNDSTYQLHSEAHEERRASADYKKTYEQFRKQYALKYIGGAKKI